MRALQPLTCASFASLVAQPHRSVTPAAMARFYVKLLGVDKDFAIVPDEIASIGLLKRWLIGEHRGQALSEGGIAVYDGGETKPASLAYAALTEDGKELDVDAALSAIGSARSKTYFLVAGERFA